MKRILIALFLTAISTSASAALLPRLGGQAVYDTDLNVTWTADGNLAASNTFGVAGINNDGSLTWYTANDWVAAMNDANYLGFNDWRMPITLVPDPSCDTPDQALGDNCVGSELGHLFYVALGASADTPATVSGDPTELAKFMNIQTRIYWSGTEATMEGFARLFSFANGLQSFLNKDAPAAIHVWAVRPGDVGVIPLPATLWLFGPALALLGWVRRRPA